MIIRLFTIFIGIFSMLKTVSFKPSLIQMNCTNDYIFDVRYKSLIDFSSIESEDFIEEVCIYRISIEQNPNDLFFYRSLCLGSASTLFIYMFHSLNRYIRVKGYLSVVKVYPQRRYVGRVLHD